MNKTNEISLCIILPHVFFKKSIYVSIFITARGQQIITKMTTLQQSGGANHQIGYVFLTQY